MTVTENRPTQARSNGISYQQLLDTDSREVPDVLRWERRFVRFIRSPLSAHALAVVWGA